MKLGSKGSEVQWLQKTLKNLGYQIAIDGDFGEKTEAAVIAYQKKNGLVADGIVGEKTYQTLLGNASDKFLKDSDFVHAAEVLQVSELTIRAFAAVEGGNSGFLNNGKPKILFERHYMYSLLKAKRGADYANEMAKLYPNVVNQTTGGYQGGTAEYIRLGIASEIDQDCALQSCSWGQFQIMGAHWQDLGYSSVDDFVAAQYQSESAQLDAFIRFIQWKSGTVAGKKVKLIDALRSGDWHAVFTLYNGANYKRLGYQAKFQAVIDRLQKVYGAKNDRSSRAQSA